MERIHPSLRLVVERYVNAIAELFHEAAEFLPDRVLQHVADRAAEACVRCRFRRAPDSEATPTSVPTIEARPTTAPVQNSGAYGPATARGGNSSDGEDSAESYEVDG